MWSSPRIIMLLLRIIEKIKLGTSVTPTPSRVKEIRLRPCPVKFWVSLRMKIPQPLSVPGPVSDHPHDKEKKKAHNLFPSIKSEFPMLQLSCDHVLPGTMWFCFLCTFSPGTWRRQEDLENSPHLPNEEQYTEMEEDGYRSTAMSDGKTGRSARVTEQMKLALFQSIPNSSKSPKQSVGVCWNIRFSLGFSFTQVSQK